jgi:hypothetical protein
VEKMEYCSEEALKKLKEILLKKIKFFNNKTFFLNLTSLNKYLFISKNFSLN